MTKIESVEANESSHLLRIILALVAIGLMLLRVNQPDLLISMLCGIPATIFLGSVLLWHAIRDLRRRWHVYQHGIQTSARVKKIRTRGRMQHAIVEFELPDNTKRTVEIQQNIAFDFGIFLPAITKEITIVIRYDVTNTTEAYIYSSLSIWLGPIVGILLAFCTFASCFLL